MACLHQGRKLLEQLRALGDGGLALGLLQALQVGLRGIATGSGLRAARLWQGATGAEATAASPSTGSHGPPATE